ncbi:MAG: DUF1743 domain-containing protein [Halobacteriaceae archaeon]
MTVVGIDDTDARTGGCTTHVATRLAARLASDATVERRLLVRCNPAVEHKTRGNASVAVHTDAAPERALVAARETVEALAADGADTGVVVAPGPPTDAPDRVAAFAARAVDAIHDPGGAARVAADAGYRTATWGVGRGLVGALAAVGAWAAFDDWTVERIAYRERERWGTERAVDPEAVFAASADAYPGAWDTVDRGAGEVLCAPRTPCPVLFGVRGDDPAAVADLAARLRETAVDEPVAAIATFLTNQGTDGHLRAGQVGEVLDGRSYRVEGIVAAPPATRRGGHVFVPLRASGGASGAADPGDDTATDAALECAAFEPTKRFRDHVRALAPGDRVTVCGEVTDGTLKLEKFAVRDLIRTERIVPACPDCDRSMESAGADAGYRCRDCGTSAPGRVSVPRERDLEVGWYEVPPRARRHLARPLVRGGFDAPVHVER